MYYTHDTPATYPHSFFFRWRHALSQALPVADHQRCRHGNEAWECHRRFGPLADGSEDLVLNDGFNMGLMMIIWDMNGIWMGYVDGSQ